jgi:MFS family permease
MIAISTFVGSGLVPLRKRGVVQGLSNVTMGCGTGLGGFLGGWLDGVWGWRWAFLIQVPFIVIGTILVWSMVRIPVNFSDKSALRRVDYLSSFTLTVGLVLLLLGLNAGDNLVPWTQPLVLVSLPLSAAFILSFVYVEIYIASEPIIPMDLLLNLTVAAVYLTYEFAYMVQYGIMFFVPLYLQLLGNSPTQAGLRFTSQSAGTATGALCTGIIIRATGWLNIGTQILLVVSSGLFATMGQDIPSWCLFVYLAAYGLGFGSMLVVTLIVLISSVDHRHQAVVTSASFALRSTGSTIGLTIGSAVFQNMLRLGLWSRLENADEIIHNIRESFDEIWRLDPAIQPVVKDSYMAALNGVFLLMLGLSIASALSSFIMRQNVLHANLARR